MGVIQGGTVIEGALHRVYENAGAPTNGTSGTYAGEADPGSLLVDTTNKTLYQNTGTKASPTWTGAPLAVGAGYKIARGQHTTVAASDTVVTGLATVVAAVASLDSDPGDDPEMVSCSIGDQAGTPAAGSILIKTWKNTGGTDPTPVAASTFTKKVNWIAIGT